MPTLSKFLLGYAVHKVLIVSKKKKVLIFSLISVGAVVVPLLQSVSWGLVPLSLHQHFSGLIC